MVFLRAILIAVLFVCASAAFAGERPSAFFCWTVRAKLAQAGGDERAAEAAARSHGVSEADIAKAKLCRR